MENINFETKVNSGAIFGNDSLSFNDATVYWTVGFDEKEWGFKTFADIFIEKIDVWVTVLDKEGDWIDEKNLEIKSPEFSMLAYTDDKILGSSLLPIDIDIFLDKKEVEVNF